MIKPSTRVYRRQIFEGYSIPAIIHNMNYFFVDLDVYENGRVQCWNFEDFDHFIQDVKRGWVKTTIPNGETISVYGLGSWKINNAEWSFSSETFIQYVEALIKDLNPNLENLYQYSQKRVNGVAIGENGDGTVYKGQPSPFYDKINGDSVNMFYKMNNCFYLIKVNVFADSSVQLSRLENPVDLSFHEFEKLVSEESILTEVPEGELIHVYGLGKFFIQNIVSSVSIREKLLEIKDMMRNLKGEPSSLQICQQALLVYLDNPTISNKEALKITYENIPQHQRRYVGDMDTKDIQVRMIIYGEREIENWSHYKIAKESGMELPSIQIPKMKDE